MGWLMAGSLDLLLCVFLEAEFLACAGLWIDLGVLLGWELRDESAFRSNGIPILGVLSWAGFGWFGAGDLRST